MSKTSGGTNFDISPLIFISVQYYSRIELDTKHVRLVSNRSKTKTLLILNSNRDYNENDRNTPLLIIRPEKF